jgi:VTC domain-containing protein
MAPDKLQTSRFELKYLIDEETALGVREVVRSYLELDENSVGKPDYSYPVHSLYLDSEDYTLYRQTINGTKNRFKLRLRFYNNEPNTPIFFEIKRRMNGCILKQRGAVRREAVDSLLAGQFPEEGHLFSINAKQLTALQSFCRLMQEQEAIPKGHIAYLREAYVPHDNNSARLTMDRKVRADQEPTARLRTGMRQPVLVWGKKVVLELKFTDRFPDWFGKLVRIFSLTQCGAAKYVEGMDCVWQQQGRASASGVTVREPVLEQVGREGRA